MKSPYVPIVFRIFHQPTYLSSENGHRFTQRDFDVTRSTGIPGAGWPRWNNVAAVRTWQGAIRARSVTWLSSLGKAWGKRGKMVPSGDWTAMDAMETIEIEDLYND